MKMMREQNMQLNTMKPGRGAKTAAKRLGRGGGSGLGKTSGKGHKGHTARAAGEGFSFRHAGESSNAARDQADQGRARGRDEGRRQDRRLNNEALQGCSD